MNPVLELAVEAVKNLITVIEEAMRASTTHDELLKALRAESDKFSQALSSLEKTLEKNNQEADKALEEKFKDKG